VGLSTEGQVAGQSLDGEHGLFSVLTPEGELPEGVEPPLDDTTVLEGLRWMMLSRTYDARMTSLQRQGLTGTVSPVKGQEAAVVGSALALDPARDWIVPAYRELPALVRHGYPLERLVANNMGKVVAGRIPDGVLVLPNQVALATQLPHAVGIAWGLKLQRRDGVVMAYCGEGAASEGDFHEACNLAGVVRAPIVFLLQNNQWAISTPRERQTAARFLADRAAGYGFPGFTVDGNDLLAVYQVAREAVERARSGGGPTLIEAHTYRLSFHNTTDNPRRYLPEGWLEEAERKDPIVRVQRYLASRGLWDDGARAAVEGEIKEEMDAAIEAARAMPAAQPEQVFDDVYASPPARLRRQRDQALRRR
jgi:pyruvate dehydrogenase E1 component alpha subunit